MIRVKQVITAVLALLLAVLIPAAACADSDAEDAQEEIKDETLFQEVSDLLYEMTGVRANDTGEMADLLESLDIREAAAALRGFLDETGRMTDEELGEILNSAAGDLGISPGDRVLSAVIRYVRSLEELSEEELEEKLDGLRDSAAVILRATDQVSSFGDSVKEFFGSVGEFFGGEDGFLDGAGELLEEAENYILRLLLKKDSGPV